MPTFNGNLMIPLPIFLTNNNRILKGGGVIPLIFPKVPQSSPGILRVPQLPPPLNIPVSG